MAERPDSAIWLAGAVEEANKYDLPYLAKWPDGTYSAISKAQLRDGGWLHAVTVETVRAALSRGEIINFTSPTRAIKGIIHDEP